MGYLISRAPPLELPVMSAKKRRQGEKRVTHLPLTSSLCQERECFFKGTTTPLGCAV